MVKASPVDMRSTFAQRSDVMFFTDKDAKDLIDSKTHMVDWKAFAKQYRGAGRYLTFSNVGFNPDQPRRSSTSLTTAAVCAPPEPTTSLRAPAPSGTSPANIPYGFHDTNAFKAVVRRLIVYLSLPFVTMIVAGIYGALHDQITYTISREYFTEFKFHQFEFLIDRSQPERIQAAMVGFLASWWMGLPLGLLAGLALGSALPRAS